MLFTPIFCRLAWGVTALSGLGVGTSFLFEDLGYVERKYKVRFVDADGNPIQGIVVYNAVGDHPSAGKTTCTESSNLAQIPKSWKKFKIGLKGKKRLNDVFKLDDVVYYCGRTVTLSINQMQSLQSSFSDNSREKQNKK